MVARVLPQAAERRLRRTEVYDHATGIFTRVGPMHAPRVHHAAVLIGEDRVLITGRRVEHDDPALGTAEIYDGAARRFELLEAGMVAPRERHVAILGLTGGCATPRRGPRTGS